MRDQKRGNQMERNARALGCEESLIGGFRIRIQQVSVSRWIPEPMLTMMPTLIRDDPRYVMQRPLPITDRGF
jgi:hypothetical protein